MLAIIGRNMPNQAMAAGAAASDAPTPAATAHTAATPVTKNAQV